MASDSDTLNDNDADDFSFSPEERKLVTQPYDLSIQTLIDQWNDGTLVLPDIQREYVWDNGKASRLVESLVLKIPIPVLYFAETDEGKYQIIDGHQRVRSVVRYIENQFALSGLWVLKEMQRMRFHHLPSAIQRQIRTRIMRAVIIQTESHPDMKFEVFERLNQGSISLNAQELRNSTYRGAFNDFLKKKLVIHDDYRVAIGSKKPRRRMVDEELILRFLAFHERFNLYRAPLKRFLNNFMSEESDASEERRDYFERIFVETINRVRAYLGPSAFRVCDEAGKPKDKALNRSLFEAQMLAFSWVEEPRTADCDSVHRAFAQCYQSQSFLDAIQKATGNTSNVMLRVRESVAALQRAGMQLQVPYELAPQD